MSKITNIVAHCSDSSWGSVPVIDGWHRERGFDRIGYQYVILNGMLLPDYFVPSMDGSISVGRPIDGDCFIDRNEAGAHSFGYNRKSVGICLIGEKEFSLRQMSALIGLLVDLCDRYGIDTESILGHYESEYAGGKTCPNIDMSHIRYMVGLAT